MITMTLPLAKAAAQDAANRNMKANGRSTWNADDYNVAVATEEKLWWINQPGHREEILSRSATSQMEGLA